MSPKLPPTAFNNRLQPTVIRQRTQAGGCLTAGGNSAADDVAYLSFQYYYSDPTKNNGNIWDQTSMLGGLTFQQSYTYDGVNRLLSATESGPGTGWTQSYGYDAVGNRWVTANPNLAGGGNFVPTSASSFNSNNCILVNAAQCDSGGNLLAIGGYQFGYDAENRMKSSLLNASTTYVYDGEGHRVQKVDAGGSTTEYVYDAGGQLAAEYTIAGAAPTPPCGTCYLMTDHLGSTRMMTDGQLAGGAVQVRVLHDYLPFGEELQSGTDGRSTLWASGDPEGNPDIKFTGKERDTETGLDYFLARYYSSAQGRFTSPDPIYFQEEMLTDPQRFNLYSYVRNNPLRYTDPSGERIELQCKTDKVCQQKLAAIQAAVGPEAGKQLITVPEKDKSKYFVEIQGDANTFAATNDAAASFAKIIANEEVAQFAFAASAENLALTDAKGFPWTLGEKPANGVTGRDSNGQLWVYVLQPSQCCMSESGADFGRFTMGGFLDFLGFTSVSTDVGTVAAHEFGHALYLMQVGPNGRPNLQDSNKAALNLENAARKAHDPNAPVRTGHPD